MSAPPPRLHRIAAALQRHGTPPVLEASAAPFPGGLTVVFERGLTVGVEARLRARGLVVLRDAECVNRYQLWRARTVR